MKLLIAELLDELVLRVEAVTDEYTDNEVKEFGESTWTKREALAYDMGYIKALKIAVDIVREQGE